MQCFAILGKFAVTMSALIALVSTTRFSDLLSGMRKLSLPKLLIIQLGFLYRYIFILIDIAHRTLRARNARKLTRLGFKKEMKITAAMVGSLLVRSIDKAERVNIAMRARGFDGSWKTISKMRIHLYDLAIVLVALSFTFCLYIFIKPILQ